MLVGGSTRIPYIRKLVKLIFSNKEPVTGVNPDEAVAYGAAIQAAVLSGVISPKKVALFDVTPLSMGIKTAGGTMSNLINRNNPVPTSKEKVFTTFKDNQKKVVIEVYEGERALVKHNHFLGKFQLTDIPPGPRGSQKFRVTFAISDEGASNLTNFSCTITRPLLWSCTHEWCMCYITASPLQSIARINILVFHTYRFMGIQ